MTGAITSSCRGLLVDVGVGAKYNLLSSPCHVEKGLDRMCQHQNLSSRREVLEMRNRTRVENVGKQPS
jgi:hypothetical protein